MNYQNNQDNQGQNQHQYVYRHNSDQNIPNSGLGADQGQYNYEQNPNMNDPEMEKIRKVVQEEIKSNKPKNLWVKIIALILAGALLGTGGTFAVMRASSYVQKLQEIPEEVPSQTKSENVQVDINLNEDSTVENAVATKAIPSIVGITAKVRGQQQNFYFYEIPEYSEAQGSGVIVDSAGYILTNSHVINNGTFEELKVSFSDDEEASAELIWHDVTLDLAIIKTDRENLTAAELGDSDQLNVGDKAIAVGNPLGLALQSTLTSGYISGLDRSITIQDSSVMNVNIMDGLIQTDAAINSGNSGGALLNAEGKVIGINTARPKAADGIGFAIPINIAKPVIEKVIAEGSFESLYLGITGVNVQMISTLNGEELPTDTGVFVQEVLPGSPADKGGLQQGDIITSINDNAVDSMNSLKGQLMKFEPEDIATIHYYRGEQEKTTEVTFSTFDFTQEEVG